MFLDFIQWSESVLNATVNSPSPQYLQTNSLQENI